MDKSKAVQRLAELLYEMEYDGLSEQDQLFDAEVILGTLEKEGLIAIHLNKEEK